MITIVIGGASSGKSRYAEALVLSLGESRTYIATMEPFGTEGERRIRKHRAMRAGSGFETLECTHNLASVAEEVTGRNVLLEDLPNLVANEIFGQGERSDEAVIASVYDGVSAVAETSAHLTIVTGDLTSDGTIYDEATERYLRILGQLGVMLAGDADQVIEVACGQVAHRFK